MNAMATAREEALKGFPVIVHADCVRIGCHSNSDSHDLYRDDDEINQAKAQDPLPAFKKLLISQKNSLKKLSIIEDDAKSIIMDAHKKALKAQIQILNLSLIRYPRRLCSPKTSEGLPLATDTKEKISPLFKRSMPL
jgi:TPP-dependent pyruvate/acetoin dehydrogenase alpha subunit